MRSWSSFVGQLALVLGLLSASLEDARADVGPLHYSVDPRAKDCPSSAEFLRDVERHMGKDDEPPLVVDRRPRVDVRIEADAHELRAYVEVDAERPEEPHGPEATAEGRLRKTLRAPAHACRDLASAVAIVVSLMFRSSGDRHAPHASAPPSPGPPADGENASGSEAPIIAQPDVVLPSQSPAPPPSAPRTPSPPITVRHTIHAGAIVGKTMVPDVGIGAIIGYGVTWSGENRRLSFGLATEATSTGARTAFAQRGGGVRIHSNGLSVGPCLHVGQLLSCTAVTLGSTIGVGTGVREPERRAFLLVEAAVRLGARIPLPPPFALRTELRVGSPITRPRFAIEGDTIWEAPPVTVLGSCSLETTF